MVGLFVFYVFYHATQNVAHEDVYKDVAEGQLTKIRSKVPKKIILQQMNKLQTYEKYKR